MERSDAKVVITRTNETAPVMWGFIPAQSYTP